MQRCPQQQTERAHGAKEKCTRGADRIPVILLGTFVLRVQGKVDNAAVAAKRVLAACFSIAREEELLRESEEHQNVVRYICIEQCHQLRYIPLEVCIATLQNYEEVHYTKVMLESGAMFRQVKLLSTGFFCLGSAGISDPCDPSQGPLSQEGGGNGVGSWCRGL